jgi:hypothetical protein
MAIDVQCKINVLIKDMSSSRYARKTTSPAATGRVLSGQSPAGTAGHCRKRVVPGNIKPEQLHSRQHPPSQPPHSITFLLLIHGQVPYTAPHLTRYSVTQSRTMAPKVAIVFVSQQITPPSAPRVLCIQCCIITTCPLYSITARVQNVPSAVLCLS